jgi:bacteriocin-like protein
MTDSKDTTNAPVDEELSIEDLAAVTGGDDWGSCDWPVFTNPVSPPSYSYSGRGK